MKNIVIAQDRNAANFTPITINSFAELQALLQNPPEPGFAPVTVVITSKAALANIIGAEIAYGTANTYAENGLKAVGLGDFYTGNVRGAARNFATELAEAAGVDTPDFAAYLGSVKFSSSRKSQAGAAVRGTDEDLAPGYAPTTFESEPVVEETEPEVEVDNDVDGDEFAGDDEVVETIDEIQGTLDRLRDKIAGR